MELGYNKTQKENNMYGDGSDGAFNHTSGTTTLALDTKHQFTTFNVASGARLDTRSDITRTNAPFEVVIRYLKTS